ncbi:eukaryotic translation initiation factor 4E [Naganishia albida]|nr:eukaryotic translation initiation factor 4E [Naganishia albida]
MAESQEKPAGILDAVSSVAQQATSVVSNALEAMHITAPNDQQNEDQQVNGKTEADLKDAADLEEGEIRQTNSKEEKQGPKTVFDDPASFNLKHPLYTPWTLYFGSPNVKNLPKTPAPSAAGGGTVEKAANWMEDIRKVVTFDSVEEFWGLHNNIVPPSGLDKKADYYLMRDAVLPAWEDPANKHGGKWSVQFPREKTRDRIDQMWLYMVLAAIGETFETDAGENKDYSAPADQSDMITGVIINARPNFYRLNIWTRDAPEEPNEPSPLQERITKIGRHFKQEVLGVPLDVKLTGTGGFSTDVEFASHKESTKKSKDNSKKIIL